MKKAVNGQFPEAVILSCIDSRVPVEEIFDKGIGDIFVARVAGNIVNSDILGSLEYACKVAGSKLVLVLGHEGCGAVKSAVDKVELGNITGLLSKITPAVEKTSGIAGPADSSNKDFLIGVVESNVKVAIETIRAESSILKEMEDSGEIAIKGAVYRLENGQVEFLD